MLIIESTVTSVMSTCLFDLYIMIQFCGSQPISLTKVLMMTTEVVCVNIIPFVTKFGFKSSVNS